MDLTGKDGAVDLGVFEGTTTTGRGFQAGTGTGTGAGTDAQRFGFVVAEMFARVPISITPPATAAEIVNTAAAAMTAGRMRLTLGFLGLLC